MTTACSVLRLLQTALLTPPEWGGELAPLLLRKWIIFHYFGLSVVGTVLATALAKPDGAGAAAVIPNLVRRPPLYELLEGSITYRDMHRKVLLVAGACCAVCGPPPQAAPASIAMAE